MKISSPCPRQLNFDITLEDNIQYPGLSDLPVSYKTILEYDVIKVIPVNGLPYLLRNRFGGPKEPIVFHFWKVFN